MASEDLFQEDFSEEVITEINQEFTTKVNDIYDETIEQKLVNDASKVTKSTSPASKLVSFEKVSLGNESNADSKSSPQERLFQLPLTRVRNLMKLDPDMHIASNEAVFAVTRSAELFIESLARESFSYTSQAKKKTLQKRDVDLAMTAVDSLTFLDGAMNF